MAEKDNRGQLINVNDVLGLEHVGPWGIKILEMIESAFGFGVKELLSSRLVKNEAERRLILLKAEADAGAYQKITLARAECVIRHESELAKTVEGRSAIRTATDAIRQQQNLEQITLAAISYAEEATSQGRAPKFENKKVDDDWLEEFKDLAKNTSQNEMQKLWGRVLAHQAAGGERFKIRDLMTLKTLTVEEAELFRKLCQLVVTNPAGNSVVVLTSTTFMQDDRLKFFDLSCDDFLALESLSLVTETNGNWAENVYLKKDQSAELKIGESVFDLLSPTDRTVSLMHAVILSSTAKRLSTLIEISAPQDYVNQVSSMIRGQCSLTLRN